MPELLGSRSGLGVWGFQVRGWAYHVYSAYKPSAPSYEVGLILLFLVSVYKVPFFIGQCIHWVSFWGYKKYIRSVLLVLLLAFPVTSSRKSAICIWNIVMRIHLNIVFLGSTCLIFSFLRLPRFLGIVHQFSLSHPWQGYCCCSMDLGCCCRGHETS